MPGNPGETKGVVPAYQTQRGVLLRSFIYPVMAIVFVVALAACIHTIRPNHSNPSDNIGQLYPGDENNVSDDSK